VYTFAETVLDTLVLIPNFVEFFQDESRRSSSPGDTAILFVAFGKPFFPLGSAKLTSKLFKLLNNWSLLQFSI
jgi:hypothetical protein